MAMRASRRVSTTWVVVLCFATFLIGTLFTNKMWTIQDSAGGDGGARSLLGGDRRLIGGRPCDTRPPVNGDQKEAAMKDLATSNNAIKSLDRTVASLEAELMLARALRESTINDSLAITVGDEDPHKAFIVIGINTAFSSKKRRDSIRETWMPQGDELRRLEEEKGIVIRFVMGRTEKPGTVVDKEIEAEEAEYGDFLRLDHIEGYHELSAKTKIYFATAVAMWDADFYVKVDDDVHVNLGTLGTTLARYRTKPRVYVGCMKSGPVLHDKREKYHEPEFWKFGEKGNSYFRHATGQIYAISKDLATYISVNQKILKKYANEDVSLGTWLIGLDVAQYDDRSMCCGTPPDCEWKMQAGSVCAASFDWTCSGVCDSVDRISDVHRRCGEDEGAVWRASFL